eukprot:scaffold225_cov388-Prasinococcus_capsulatus_cf.AAC.21
MLREGGGKRAAPPAAGGVGPELLTRPPLRGPKRPRVASRAKRDSNNHMSRCTRAPLVAREPRGQCCPD